MPADRDLSILDGFRVAATGPAESQTADFGDQRLTDRLQRIATRLGRAPRQSIPAACSEWAATKTTYRICDNETVDPTDVLAAHSDDHADRLTDLDEVLVVPDTTHLTFPSHPAKEGLGDVGNSSIDVEGVKLHTSIGIDPTSQVMTGLLDQQVTNRPAINTIRTVERRPNRSRASRPNGDGATRPPSRRCRPVSAPFSSTTAGRTPSRFITG